MTWVFIYTAVGIYVSAMATFIAPQDTSEKTLGLALLIGLFWPLTVVGFLVYRAALIVEKIIRKDTVS